MLYLFAIEYLGSLMKVLQDAPQCIFMQTLIYFYFFSVIFLNVRSRECRAVLTGHQIMQTALTVESAECR